MMTMIFGGRIAQWHADQPRVVAAAQPMGACQWPTPGPGGWGALLRFECARWLELGGAAANTTNNRKWTGCRAGRARRATKQLPLAIPICSCARQPLPDRWTGQVGWRAGNGKGWRTGFWRLSGAEQGRSGKPSDSGPPAGRALGPRARAQRRSPTTTAATPLPVALLPRAETPKAGDAGRCGCKPPSRCQSG